MSERTSNTGWQNVPTGRGSFVNWKQTKLVEGLVTAIVSYTYKKQKREKLQVTDTKTGEIFDVGQYAQLEQLFRIAKKGDMVRIRLTGKKKMKGGKQPMLTFDVKIKPKA